MTDTEFSDYDPTDYLTTPDQIAAYLEAALEEAKQDSSACPDCGARHDMDKCAGAMCDCCAAIQAAAGDEPAFIAQVRATIARAQARHGLGAEGER